MREAFHHQVPCSSHGQGGGGATWTPACSTTKPRADSDYYHFTGTLKTTRAAGVYGIPLVGTSLKKRVANARRSTPP